MRVSACVLNELPGHQTRQFTEIYIRLQSNKRKPDLYLYSSVLTTQRPHSGLTKGCTELDDQR